MDFEYARESKLNDTAYWNDRLKNQDERPLSPNEVGHMRYEKGSLAVISRNFARFLFANRKDRERANELAQQAVQLYLDIGQPDNAEDTKKMAATGGLYFGDTFDEAIRLFVEEMVSRRAKELAGGSDPVSRAWLCPTCGGTIPGGVATTVCPDCGQRVCSACGAALSNDAIKCAECQKVLCPQCGIAVDDDYARCPACETLLPLCCEHCGTPASAGDLVCEQCGEGLD